METKNDHLYQEQAFQVSNAGKSPVSPEETSKIYAFMEAADQSKRESGISMNPEAVLNKGRIKNKDKKIF